MIERLNKLFLTEFSENDIEAFLCENCFICKKNKVIEIKPNVFELKTFQCNSCNFIYFFCIKYRGFESIIFLDNEINLSIYYANKITFIVKNKFKIIIPPTFLKETTTYKDLLSIMDRARKLKILL